MACGGIGKIARDLRVFLRAGHRQQIGIARLAARQRCRGGHHAAQRFVVGLVGGGARRAAVEHGAHRNGERLLGDVLVDRVVGEARQRVGAGVDFDFGFVGVAKLQMRSAMRRSSASEGRCASATAGRWRDALRLVGSVPRGFAAISCRILRARGSCYFCEAPRPRLMLRKRAGDAPWPVPMVCMGWPLPQLGVPQSVQCSREQMASQLFQNSVVMPL